MSRLERMPPLKTQEKQRLQRKLSNGGVGRKKAEKREAHADGAVGAPREGKQTAKTFSDCVAGSGRVKAPPHQAFIGFSYCLPPYFRSRRVPGRITTATQQQEEGEISAGL